VREGDGDLQFKRGGGGGLAQGSDLQDGLYAGV